ncbi:MAG: sigma-70 family RNA polymerase sigma factor [Xanthobacteraceae bacterium]
MTEAPVRLRDFIEAVAEGDRSALEHLYKATSDKLYGVVLRVLRKPELAEEALAEAYLRVWREAGHYAPVLLDPTSWLVMHARRAALDIARKRAELGHEEMADVSEQTAETEGEDSERVVSDELKQLLGCMARLSADPRLMLLLAYYDGWSHTELAIEFDAPPGTIRTWMLRGLEQIRECTGP